jgi:uncharacterized membrane protein YhaH (DUF805 family)
MTPPHSAAVVPENLMGAVISAGIFKRVVLAHYFDFHGRAGRAEFWNYIAVFIAITLVAEIVFRVFSVAPVRILFTAWALGFFLPTIGIAIRRLHDLGRTGWLLVTPLVPAFLMLLLFFWFWPITVVLAACMIGSAWYLLYLCLQPGMTAQNRYGPVPA